jgi:DNA-binding NarL/FixJ family response regulator
VVCSFIPNCGTCRYCAGLQVTREVTGQVRPLPEAVELTAYRVIQQSLTNTRKHTDCDTAVLRLGYAPGALKLAVEDEGQAVIAAGRRMPAVRVAREARADVVLMDIRMPGLDGLAATRRIAADDSLAGVRVLILTTFEADEYLFEALRSGAAGFLGQGARPDVLIEGIRTVARGDALLSPSATRGLIARFLRLHDSEPARSSPLLASLTDREREVVAMVAEGMSNTEIACQLTLSPLTVKTHANHAMAKLGARDRAQLVVFASQTGLARAPRPGRPATA